MEQKRAIITGADGGMGRVITEAIAQAGYEVIMACHHPEEAEKVCQTIREKTQNPQIEVRGIDLASLKSVDAFTRKLLQEGKKIHLLINNAGVLSTEYIRTEDGFEQTVSVNYVAPFFLIHNLSPLMVEGTRVVNTVSCTYAIGKYEKNFFEKGRNGNFWRIPIYSNSKYALLLLTLYLSEQWKEKGIHIHAVDPGIVDTNIITMHMWFDPLTDLFFRPIIRTPKKGAATAIAAALSPLGGKESGRCWASEKPISLGKRYYDMKIQETLIQDTFKAIQQAGFQIERNY